MKLRAITETLDTRADLKWTSDSHAQFQVGRQQYDVYLDAKPATDPRLEGAVALAIQFQRKLGMLDKLKYKIGRGPDAFGVSGTGGEMIVFGSVLEAVKQYVSGHPDVQVIAFIGLEENRFSLYQKLAKRYARGWVQISTPPQLMLATQQLCKLMEQQEIDPYDFPNQYWA